MPSTKTSGVRFGTPACTTRGFKEEDFVIVGNLIADVVDFLVNGTNIDHVKKAVFELTAKYPLNYN